MTKVKFSKSNTSVKTRELVAELEQAGLTITVAGDYIAGYKVIAKKGGIQVACVDCGATRAAVHASLKTLIDLNATQAIEETTPAHGLETEIVALKAELAKAQRTNKHAMGEIERLVAGRDAISKEIEAMRNTIKGVIAEMGNATAWVNFAQKKLINQINYANTR